MNASTKSCLHVAFHEMTFFHMKSLMMGEDGVISTPWKSPRARGRAGIGPSLLRICRLWLNIGLGCCVPFQEGLPSHKALLASPSQERGPELCGCRDAFSGTLCEAPAKAGSIPPHSRAHRSRNAQGDRLVGCKTQWRIWTKIVDQGRISVTLKSLSPVPRVLSYSWKNKKSRVLEPSRLR